MLKTAIKAATTAVCTLLLAGIAGEAMAFEMPKYDKKIEAAAREIVAKKVGAIRGSVAGEWVAEFGVDETVTGPIGVADGTVENANPVMLLASLAAARVMPQRRVRLITSFIYY